MRWDFWELMLLFLSFEIPLSIAPLVMPASERWLPLGRTHFNQLAILALTATFLYAVIAFVAHAK
jgi:hypothetical protein